MTDKPKRVIVWARVSSEEQGAANKESIPQQLARQRQLAADNGWTVVDELITDFSMNFFTYDEFSKAAAAAGWYDPLRMWEHWKNKDFDILTCRYLDRVGREQSILSEFIGRTMKAGAIIVPLDEATVDGINYRMTSAIAGLGAAQHVDKLKSGREMGQRGHASRGEKLGNRVPMFYQMTADKKLVPDRARYQRFFDDLYELFIAGTSYEQLPFALEQRGHVHPVSGKRFDRTVVKYLMITARTWGHGEYNRKNRKNGRTSLRAEHWITGRSEPPPEVFFQRNVCEPIWQGEQYEEMLDELERRFFAIRGAARPHRTYAFSALCVCDVCGTPMIVQALPHNLTTFYYMKCPNGRRHDGCTNNLGVRFEKIQDLLTAFIEERLRDPSAVLTVIAPPVNNRLPAIERDLAKAQAKLDNLIDLISEQQHSARADFQAKIDAATANRDALRAEKARHEFTAREVAHQERSRLKALDELREMGVPRLWEQPTTKQNQILRKALGNLRVACDHGEPVGMTAVAS